MISRPLFVLCIALNFVIPLNPFPPHHSSPVTSYPLRVLLFSTMTKLLDLLQVRTGDRLLRGMDTSNDIMMSVFLTPSPHL